MLSFNIDESVFETTLKEKLGNKRYKRALSIFQKIDESKSLELIQILMRAVERGKVAKIIAELERHTQKSSLNRFDLEEIEKIMERLKKELGI